MTRFHNFSMRQLKILNSQIHTSVSFSDTYICFQVICLQVVIIPFSLLGKKMMAFMIILAIFDGCMSCEYAGNICGTELKC